MPNEQDHVSSLQLTVHCSDCTTEAQPHRDIKLPCLIVAHDEPSCPLILISQIDPERQSTMALQ